MHLPCAGVASTEENRFESCKSEWPTEVRIGSSPIAHLFLFFIKNIRKKGKDHEYMGMVQSIQFRIK